MDSSRALYPPSQTKLSDFKRPVIAIVGPTASGKSALAQSVGCALDGEVVSADSMQIYRYMNIGTAKVMPYEQQIPHHLIDILDPGESYSAQLFQDQARAAFCNIYDRGKVPILCGGTGFYVQAALEEMSFPKGEQESNPLRAFYESLCEEQGDEALWSILHERDPQSAALIHPHNSKRVIRALEMNAEGVSYAGQVKNIRNLPEVVWSLRFFLQVDPDLLAKRINDRVDQMREAGLVDEVEALLHRGFASALTAPQAIGYKEIIAAKNNEISLDEAFRQIKQATRRYAKRQRSWFRRDKRLIILDTQALTCDEMTTLICRHYQDAIRTAQWERK